MTSIGSWRRTRIPKTCHLTGILILAFSLRIHLTLLQGTCAFAAWRLKYYVGIAGSSRLSLTRSYTTTGVRGLATRMEPLEGTVDPCLRVVRQELVGRARRMYWPRKRTLTSHRRLRTLWRQVSARANHLPRRLKGLRPSRPHLLTSRTTMSRICPTISVDNLSGAHPTLLTRTCLVGLARDVLHHPRGPLHQSLRTDPLHRLSPYLHCSHPSQGRRTFHNLVEVRRILECRSSRFRMFCRIPPTKVSTSTHLSTGMMIIPVRNHNHPVGITQAPL